MRPNNVWMPSALVDSAGIFGLIMQLVQRSFWWWELQRRNESENSNLARRTWVWQLGSLESSGTVELRFFWPNSCWYKLLVITFYSVLLELSLSLHLRLGSNQQIWWWSLRVSNQIWGAVLMRTNRGERKREKRAWRVHRGGLRVFLVGESGEGEEREREDHMWGGFWGIFLWYIQREMKC